MREERWSRLEGLFDVGALRTKRVLVAGLGSGGSAVALELAKAGTGHLTLVDPDRLEEANVIRHECDDRYLGWNKARAVADLVAHRNPDARVDALAADVFDLGARLERIVRDADLVAVCTDTERSRHLLNRTCIAAGVTAVYGGVYARGIGGEIVRCGGGPADPCYACVSSALKGSVPAGADDEEPDYGMVRPDGSLEAAPGLGLDVRLVALVHARVCLLTLLGSERGTDPGVVPADRSWSLEANVVIVGIAPLEGLFTGPFGRALVTVAPQDHCMVCGPFRKGEVGAAV